MDTVWYNENSELRYKFPQKGTYQITYFTRRKNAPEIKKQYRHDQQIIITHDKI